MIQEHVASLDVRFPIGFPTIVIDTIPYFSLHGERPLDPIDLES